MSIKPLALCFTSHIYSQRQIIIMKFNFCEIVEYFALYFFFFHFPLIPAPAVASLPEGVTKQQFHPNFNAPRQQCCRTKNKDKPKKYFCRTHRVPTLQLLFPPSPPSPPSSPYPSSLFFFFSPIKAYLLPAAL